MKVSKTKKNHKNHPEIIITAGPTREPVDPIRFLSNRSTGTMGYEIARQCRRQGLKVCLISGPVAFSDPKNIEVIKVETACQMRDQVVKRAIKAKCLIMAAAVSDFRPARVNKQKIKKGKSLELKMVQNPDILKELKKEKNLVKIGFALETTNVIKSAKKKLKDKNLDLIVANKKSAHQNPFGEGRVSYSIISKDAQVHNFKNKTKKEIARIILSEMGKLLK